MTNGPHQKEYEHTIEMPAIRGYVSDILYEAAIIPLIGRTFDLTRMSEVSGSIYGNYIVTSTERPPVAFKKENIPDYHPYYFDHSLNENGLFVELGLEHSLNNKAKKYVSYFDMDFIESNKFANYYGMTCPRDIMLVCHSLIEK